MNLPDYIAIVGLDEEQSHTISEQLSLPTLCHVTLPQIMVKEGQLLMENSGRPKYLPVSKVIYHAIFENDLDFITGLAFWGGAALPNPLGMMDARLKLPCLVRALRHSRFGMPRDFASPHAYYSAQQERVAKWGNWHCGENKERFTGSWSGEEAAVIEPFLEGEAVRVVIIGNQAWQIKLEGDDWLKSIHHNSAAFMPLDDELLDDTETIRQAFGLEIMANNYIVAPDGSKYLLEVNHIPNVTRFPEIWAAYVDYVVEWVKRN
jgi:hypothetical protein